MTSSTRRERPRTTASPSPDCSKFLRRIARPSSYRSRTSLLDRTTAIGNCIYWMLLERCCSSFVVADADHLVNARKENLSIANAPGASHRNDCLDHAIDHLVSQYHF